MISSDAEPLTPKQRHYAAINKHFQKTQFLFLPIVHICLWNSGLQITAMTDKSLWKVALYCFRFETSTAFEGKKKKSGAKSQRVKSIMRDRNPNPMKLGTHLRHLTLEQSMYRTRMVLKQYLSQYVTKIRVQSKIFLFCFIVWTFTEMSTYMSFCHSSSLSVALF